MFTVSRRFLERRLGPSSRLTVGHRAGGCPTNSARHAGGGAEGACRVLPADDYRAVDVPHYAGYRAAGRRSRGGGRREANGRTSGSTFGCVEDALSQARRQRIALCLPFLAAFAPLSTSDPWLQMTVPPPAAASPFQQPSELNPPLAVDSVHGHEKVPTGGRMRSPLVATKSPHWWPDEVPTGGHEKSPLVASRSPHPSLKHPPEESHGR